MADCSTAAPRRPAPLFVLSPPRSYSTVTVALLGGHPAIFGLPEMLTFSAPTVGELIAGTGCGCKAAAGNHPPSCQVLRVRLTGPYRALAHLHEGSQAPEAIERAAAWLWARSDWPTERLLDHVLELAAPQLGLEKSPDTVRTEASLARCLRRYPDARFVHLTRHPITAQRSLQEHLDLISPAKSRLHLNVSAATIWYLSHVRIIRALRALPRHQWLRVRGEDLLAEPLKQLPPMLDWLGLPHDERTVTGMLRTERWAFAGSGPVLRLFGGDHKFMQRPALRAPEPDPPNAFDPDWGLPAEMCDRMTALARSLGYAMDTTGSGRPG
jgi:hypothetical protein